MEKAASPTLEMTALVTPCFAARAGVPAAKRGGGGGLGSSGACFGGIPEASGIEGQRGILVPAPGDGGDECESMKALLERGSIVF